MDQERQAAVEHIKTSDPLAFHEKVRSAGGTDTCGSQDDLIAPQPQEAASATSTAGAIPLQLHVRGTKRATLGSHLALLIVHTLATGISYRSCLQDANARIPNARRSIVNVLNMA